MNRAEYAQHRGVSRAAVTKAIKDGRITLCTDGTIDAEIADIEWRNNTNKKVEVPSNSSSVSLRTKAEPQSQYIFDDEPKDLYKAMAQKESALAQLAMMEVMKQRNLLASTEHISNVAFKVARALRDVILGLPPVLAAELASINDPFVLEARLASALKSALNKVQDEIPKAMTELGINK
jgi:hypothetical protein